MITALQIRDRLASYVDGQSTITEFYDWLLSRSLNMHKDSNHEAQELVLDLNEHIYAATDGFIDEATLRERLRPYAREYQARRVIDVARPQSLTPSSRSQTEEKVQYA